MCIILLWREDKNKNIYKTALEVRVRIQKREMGVFLGSQFYRRQKKYPRSKLKILLPKVIVLRVPKFLKSFDIQTYGNLASRIINPGLLI